MNFRWANGNKYLSITNYWKACKKNRRDHSDDPDIRKRGYWGIHTNGAKKGIHSCLDWTLRLGYIEINYTNYAY